MALKSIRIGALACTALVMTFGAAAYADDDVDTPAAAAAATTPKQLTKPKSGTSDSGIDSYFSVVGTKKGALLAWTNLQQSPLAITPYVQPVGADGKADGKPVKLESGILEGAPSLVDLGGDEFGVVWKSGANALKGAVVDAKKGKVGKPSTVLGGQAGSYVRESASLGKDKVALITRRQPAFNQEETILIILNAKTLKPVGSPKVIENDVPPPTGASWEQAITAYDGGAMAMFHDAKGQITGVPVDGKGKAGKPVQINSTAMAPFSFSSSYATFNVKGAPTDDGGFVATWLQHYPGQNLNFFVRARLFDKKGKPVGADFIANATQYGSQVAPEVLPLKKGFGVAWTNFPPRGESFATHRVRYFDADGLPISGDIVTNYFEAGTPGTPIFLNFTSDTDYARLAKDAYLKVFGVGLGDGASLYVDGLPAPQIFSDDGETIDATGSSDQVILALGGADSVTGGSGADTIDGGDGNDTIDGGAGANQILPGLGNDEIHAGADAEVFKFGAGEGDDVILDFGANDRIDVSALPYANKSEVRADAKQDGDDVLITLDGPPPSGPAPKTTIRLKGRTLAQFADANIIL